MIIPELRHDIGILSYEIRLAEQHAKEFAEARISGEVVKLRELVKQMDNSIAAHRKVEAELKAQVDNLSVTLDELVQDWHNYQRRLLNNGN